MYLKHTEQNSRNKVLCGWEVLILQRHRHKEGAYVTLMDESVWEVIMGKTVLFL